MNDDWGAFSRADHGVRSWLGSEPEQALGRAIRAALAQTHPSLVVERVRVVGEPYALTCAQPRTMLVGGTAGTLQTTCAAFALPCELDATVDGSPTVWRGVFSWLAEGLNTPDPYVSTRFDRDAGMACATHDLERRFTPMRQPYTSSPSLANAG